MKSIKKYKRRAGLSDISFERFQREGFIFSKGCVQSTDARMQISSSPDLNLNIFRTSYQPFDSIFRDFQETPSPKLAWYALHGSWSNKSELDITNF